MRANIKKHAPRLELFSHPLANMGLPLKESFGTYAKPGTWMDPEHLSMDFLGEWRQFVDK
jgi:hypothetical protein